MIDVNNPTTNLEDLRTKLKQIIQEEDDAVMGPS
jgi:hypothetical protein